MTEKLTHVYMMLMLGLFPLWVGWSGYSNLTAQKYGFFTAATVLWLALLLVCALRERDLRFQLTAGQRAVCALTAGLCLSALCSPYGADTLVGAGRYDGLVTWGCTPPSSGACPGTAGSDCPRLTPWRRGVL